MTKEAYRKAIRHFFDSDDRNEDRVAAIRAYVAALQAERDALKARIEGSKIVYMPKNLDGIVGMDPDDTAYYAVPVESESKEQL